jgi:hypothetical protein
MNPLTQFKNATALPVFIALSFNNMKNTTQRIKTNGLALFALFISGGRKFEPI